MSSYESSSLNIPGWKWDQINTERNQADDFNRNAHDIINNFNSLVVFEAILNTVMLVLPIVVVLGVVIYFWRHYQRSIKQSESEEEHSSLLHTDLEAGDQQDQQGQLSFTYDDLRNATNGFSPDNVLGKGGFGTVYKATLKDGTLAAVKKLTLESEEGKNEFLNEVNIVRNIQHKSLVKLKGYCIKGYQMLLVYELMENGSLHHALFDESCSIYLDSNVRFNVVLGVARGLAYLHEDSELHIIHRDIKASNILLDKKLSAKISDFGVSKFFNVEKGYTSTRIAGTFGYLAPEYALYGLLTAKADVYSFGVLLLEIISGKRCHDPKEVPGQQLLLQRIWKLKQAGKLHEAIDNNLQVNIVLDQSLVDKFLRSIQIGLVCTNENEDTRPTMSDVVAMLLGYQRVPEVQPEMPGYLAHYDTTSYKTSQTSNTDKPATVHAFELEFE